MADTKTLHERLAEVQEKLKAPKKQNNTFGGYKYRSCEDILEAVKPLLKEQGLVLTLSDELMNIGDRYYVKATALLASENVRDDYRVFAYAREEEAKKGMDSSQITGTASSYARKYALNGLFLIDDTKDADSTEYHKQSSHPDSKASSRPAVQTPRQPASKPSAQTDGVECEVPGCHNTVRKTAEKANREMHEGHAICKFHHDNGSWKTALAKASTPAQDEPPIEDELFEGAVIDE